MGEAKSSKHTSSPWTADSAQARDPRRPDSKTGVTPPAGEAIPSGRIVHDERGNAVWDSGRSESDSTSAVLRRLEVPELKFEGQEEAPPTAPAAPSARVKPTAPPTKDFSGGYNPYDQGKAVRKPTVPKGPVGRRTR